MFIGRFTCSWEEVYSLTIFTFEKSQLWCKAAGINKTRCMSLNLSQLQQFEDNLPP